MFPKVSFEPIQATLLCLWKLFFLSPHPFTPSIFPSCAENWTQDWTLCMFRKHSTISQSYCKFMILLFCDWRGCSHFLAHSSYVGTLSWSFSFTISLMDPFLSHLLSKVLYYRHWPCSSHIYLPSSPSSTHPLLHPPILSFIYPSSPSSIHPLLNPPILSLIYPSYPSSTYPLLHPPILSFIHPSSFSFIHPLLLPPILSFIHPSTPSSNHPILYPPIPSFIHPSSL